MKSIIDMHSLFCILKKTKESSINMQSDVNKPCAVNKYLLVAIIPKPYLHLLLLTTAA